MKKGMTPENRGKLNISKEGEIRGGSEQKDREELMNSLMEDDKETKQDGQLLQEMMDRGMQSFVPDKLFEHLVSSYQTAKNIYGESLIRQLTGYDPNAVQKNIKIPEFQREIKEKMKRSLQKLRRENLINNENKMTNIGRWLAAASLFKEELEDMEAKGIIGEKFNQNISHYGNRLDTKDYKKGDRYKDIALKQSIKKSIRIGHSKLSKDDLKTFTRQAKGKICIIYGIDASGSMKGDKLTMCKKAGLALAYTAIKAKDEVGMIVFGKEIQNKVNPTTNFHALLERISDIKAADETNLSLTIKTSISMFPKEEMTKHLILLTDAMPTVGEDPVKETLEAARSAYLNDITISLVGVQLDKNGKELAEKITKTTNGKLYLVKNIKELDRIVLSDYYSQNC